MAANIAGYTYNSSYVFQYNDSKYISNNTVTADGQILKTGEQGLRWKIFYMLIYVCSGYLEVEAQYNV